MASKTIYFSVLHDNDAVCVVGSEPAIEKEKELFDTVLPLISC